MTKPLIALSILDEFSEKCFLAEMCLLPITRKNCINTLLKTKHKIDLLFVESVWRGPANSWSHALIKGKFGIPAEKEIATLTKECKKRGIPTLFWNKEDPFHFNNFLSVSKYFDWVATTDINCVPLYKKELKHNRILVLPFAAQIGGLHTPIGISNRIKKACFAGMYWANQHDERRQDMEYILKPAIEFGLDIYDRSKVGGGGNPFPIPYNKCVLGGLSYLNLTKKYHEYRVFLNVNIVKNSPTMFSRRVFELLACGTPVISSPSVGIEKMLPEVLISHNEQETKQHLEKLLNDDEYWKKVSIAGIKRILSEHTYSHRMKTICENMKIKKNLC